MIIHAKKLVVDAFQILEPGWVVIDQHGMIDAVLSSEPDETTAILQADIVTPGFIDLHNHGIGGSNEIAEYWLYPEYTTTRLAQHGVTSMLATMVFPSQNPSDSCCPTASSPAQTRAVAQRLNAVCGVTGHGTVIEGIHAEGPIIATLGGLPQSDAHMPLDEFCELLDALGPALRVMTIAPSVDAPELLRMKELVKRGIIPALGHDKEATEADILAALTLGTAQAPLHITHLYNVMKMHHRENGLANFALCPKFPKLKGFENLVEPTVEIIGDLAHVSALTLSAAIEAKKGKVSLISDAVAEPVEGLGLMHGDREAHVARNELGLLQVQLGQGTLIGSCITMHDAFVNAHKRLGLSLEVAVDLCCCTPARVARLEHAGQLKVGCRGDMVLMTEELEIQQVLVAGSCQISCPSCE